MNLLRLQSTVLVDAHQKLGAKMVEFGGWNMPLMYSSIVEEHNAVRRTAGVFDISHMGEFFVKDASEESGASVQFLNSLLTNDVSKLGVGQGQYTLMLNEMGGVIDDLILYRIAPSEFLLVVNAARIAEDRSWFFKQLKMSVASADDVDETSIQACGILFSDRSSSLSALALQGPRAVEIAEEFFTRSNLVIPSRNGIVAAPWREHSIWIARTGYTGEDGVELILPNEIAEPCFYELLASGADKGLKPAGLGARDTLRLEAGLPLNGNDLSRDRTPLQSGLSAFVALTKKVPFIGQAALEKQLNDQPAQMLVAFRVLQGPPPRAHYAVYRGLEQVGEVTSGAPSPTLGIGIGLAYVNFELARVGNFLELEIRGRRVPIELVKKPFYKRQK